MEAVGSSGMAVGRSARGRSRCETDSNANETIENFNGDSAHYAEAVMQMAPGMRRAEA